MAAVQEETKINLIPFLWKSYNYAFYDNADERVVDWPLMDSVVIVLVIMALYTYASCWLGPKLMTGRKPFHLKTAMTVYNVFQISFNAWMLSMAVRGGWFTGYSFVCQPIERTPRGLIMAKLVWWYYISKYVDFIDTMFFVLRKKYNQISFLHVAHHGGMTLLAWYGTRFIPGGHVTSFCLINCFIHVIMYVYYFLAGLGEWIQKYLWWKKYLTVIQMIQFIIGTSHQLILLFVECDYPRFHVFWECIFGPWIFILFLNFYLDSFTKSRHALKEKQQQEVSKAKELVDSHATNGKFINGAK